LVFDEKIKPDFIEHVVVVHGLRHVAASRGVTRVAFLHAAPLVRDSFANESDYGGKWDNTSRWRHIFTVIAFEMRPMFLGKPLQPFVGKAR
jgi:hypothetical protein